MPQRSDFRDLTPPQRAILARFEREERFTRMFYFTGGTLLKALGIVPRESNDLDFFTFPGTDALHYRAVLTAMRGMLAEMFGPSGFDETDRGFTVKESGTIVDCIFDVVPLLEDTEHYGNLAVASIRDMAACKAGALCSRDEVKDYIDIAFLTQKEGWLLADLERLAEEKYRLGTVTEEKLLEELLHKRDLFTVEPERFLRDGAASARLVREQIEFLLTHSSL